MSAIGSNGIGHGARHRVAVPDLTVDQRADLFVDAGQGQLAGVQYRYDFWVDQELTVKGSDPLNRTHFKMVRQALAKRGFTIVA